MIRIIGFFLATTLAALAQDARRMNEVAESHAKNGRFMGSALVARGDDVLFEQSYGSANVEWEIANAATTKFRIGSVTKQFTAAAILLLEERGKLSVGDVVSKHVPNSPLAWEKVTISHLLAHTSGIPSFTGFPDYNVLKLSPTTAEKTVARFRDRPLEFEPGAKHVYSNSGYLLLGYIIERVSGQSYEAFLQENIFKPLGMIDTGLDSNLAIIPRRAAGYVPGPKGPSNAPYVDMTIPHGAGALYSTTRDLHRWQQALYGGKLLSAPSLEKMTTPHLDNYAFGVSVQTVDGRKRYSHGGGIEGFNSHLIYFPVEKITVVVLSNINGPASQLAQQLAKVAFNEPVTLPVERKEIAVAAEKLKDYTGTYQLNPRIKNMVRLVDGQLTTQLSGQSQLPLFAESESKFFLKIVDAQVEFVRDDSGKVTHLLQHQNGRTQKAERISDTVEERKAIDVPATKLARYPGTYEIRPGFALTITLEGEQLMSQATGQQKLPLFAESETKFFYKAVDAQLEFFQDDQGAITHAVLHQGGRDFRAQRK